MAGGPIIQIGMDITQVLTGLKEIEVAAARTAKSGAVAGGKTPLATAPTAVNEKLTATQGRADQPGLKQVGNKFREQEIKDTARLVALEKERVLLNQKIATSNPLLKGSDPTVKAANAQVTSAGRTGLETRLNGMTPEEQLLFNKSVAAQSKQLQAPIRSLPLSEQPAALAAEARRAGRGQYGGQSLPDQGIASPYSSATADQVLKTAKEQQAQQSVIAGNLTAEGAAAMLAAEKLVIDSLGAQATMINLVTAEYEAQLAGDTSLYVQLQASRQALSASIKASAAKYLVNDPTLLNTTATAGATSRVAATQVNAATQAAVVADPALATANAEAETLLLTSNQQLAALRSQTLTVDRQYLAATEASLAAQLALTIAIENELGNSVQVKALKKELAILLQSQSAAEALILAQSTENAAIQAMRGEAGVINSALRNTPVASVMRTEGSASTQAAVAADTTLAQRMVVADESILYSKMQMQTLLNEALATQGLFIPLLENQLLSELALKIQKEELLGISAPIGALEQQHKLLLAQRNAAAEARLLADPAMAPVLLQNQANANARADVTATPQQLVATTTRANAQVTGVAADPVLTQTLATSQAERVTADQLLTVATNQALVSNVSYAQSSADLALSQAELKLLSLEELSANGSSAGLSAQIARTKAEIAVLTLEQKVAVKTILAGDTRYIALQAEELALKKTMARTGGVGAGAAGGGMFSRVVGRIKGSQDSSAAGFLGAGALSSIRHIIPSMLLFGAAAGLAKSISEAEQFNVELIKIQDQIDSIDWSQFGTTSSKAFSEIKEEIIGISKETGLQLDIVANLTQQLVGAFANEEIGGMVGLDLVKAQVDGVAKIATITKIAPAELTDGLTAAALAFGRNAEDIGNVAVALERSSGVLANETISFIGDVAPVAEEAGFSLEEFSSLAATVQQRSGKSGAALAENFNRIIPAISESKDKLLELASTSDALRTPEFINAVNSSNYKIILQTIAKEYENLSEEQKKYVISLLGGRREAATLVTAFSNSDVLTRLTDDANDAAGSLDSRYQSVLGSLTVAAKALGQQLHIVGKELLDSGLGDTLSLAVASLGKLATAIGFAIKGMGYMNKLSEGFLGNVVASALAFRVVRGIARTTLVTSVAAKLPGSAARIAASQAAAAATAQQAIADQTLATAEADVAAIQNALNIELASSVPILTTVAGLTTMLGEADLKLAVARGLLVEETVAEVGAEGALVLARQAELEADAAVILAERNLLIAKIGVVEAYDAQTIAGLTLLEVQNLQGAALAREADMAIAATAATDGLTAAKLELAAAEAAAPVAASKKSGTFIGSRLLAGLGGGSVAMGGLVVGVAAIAATYMYLRKRAEEASEAAKEVAKEQKNVSKDIIKSLGDAPSDAKLTETKNVRALDLRKMADIAENQRGFIQKAAEFVKDYNTERELLISQAVALEETPDQVRLRKLLEEEGTGRNIARKFRPKLGRPTGNVGTGLGIIGDAAAALRKTGFESKIDLLSANSLSFGLSSDPRKGLGIGEGSFFTDTGQTVKAAQGKGGATLKKDEAKYVKDVAGLGGIDVKKLDPKIVQIFLKDQDNAIVKLQEIQRTGLYNGKLVDDQIQASVELWLKGLAAGKSANPEAAKYAMDQLSAMSDKLNNITESEKTQLNIEELKKAFDAGRISINSYTQQMSEQILRQMQVIAMGTTSTADTDTLNKLLADIKELQDTVSKVAQERVDLVDRNFKIKGGTDSTAALQAKSKSLISSLKQTGNDALAPEIAGQFALDYVEIQQQMLEARIESAYSAQEAVDIANSKIKIPPAAQLGLLKSGLQSLLGNYNAFNMAFQSFFGQTADAYLGALLTAVNGGKMTITGSKKDLQEKLAVAQAALDDLNARQAANDAQVAADDAAADEAARGKAPGFLPGPDVPPVVAPPVPTIYKSVLQWTDDKGKKSFKRKKIADGTYRQGRDGVTYVMIRGKWYDTVVDPGWENPLSRDRVYKLGLEKRPKKVTVKDEEATARAQRAANAQASGTAAPETTAADAPPLSDADKALQESLKTIVETLLTALGLMGDGLDATLEEGKKEAAKKLLQDERQAQFSLFAAVQEFNGDIIGAAKTNIIAAEEAVANASTVTEAASAQQALLSAQKGLEDAANKERESQFALFSAIIAGSDPVAQAKISLVLAQQQADEARGVAAQADAAKNLIDVQNQLRDAMADARNAQYELRQAELAAMGDDIGAAQVAAQAARSQLADAIAANAGTAAIDRLRAGTISADRAARDAIFSGKMDDYKWLLDMGKITKSQYANYLEGLKTTLIPGTKQFKDLELTIKQLKNDIGSDLQQNLPTSLALPTLYEVRRLDQVSQTRDSAGTPGIGYQDNRTQDIKIYVNNGMGESEVVQVLSDALGTGRSGSGPRRY